MASEKRSNSLASTLGNAIVRRLDTVDVPRLLAKVGVGLFLRTQSMGLSTVLAFGAGIIAGALATPVEGGALRRAMRSPFGRWGRRSEAGQVVTSGGERVPPFDEREQAAQKDEVRAERRAEEAAEGAAEDGKLGPV